MAATGDSPITTLEIAETGGRHSGFLKLRLEKPAAELLREATNLQRQAAEHQEKLANRIGYNQVSEDPVVQKRADDGRSRHLLREAENFTQQAELCEQLAARKTLPQP